ncbi:S-adenosyl-L-methionine-dependent methyltransferase [Phlyctochytrium arcticum]|nr:S-adenosyl-L-methionine-dependent methyltransferase [Phlyctochytrium arcticum]
MSLCEVSQKFVTSRIYSNLASINGCPVRPNNNMGCIFLLRKSPLDLVRFVKAKSYTAAPAIGASKFHRAMSITSTITPPGTPPLDLTKAKTWSPAAYTTHGHFVHSSEHTAPILALLAPEPTDRILDLGCGDGHLTRRLITHLRTSSVVGIDASEAMIEAAEKVCRAEMTAGRIALHVGDGMSLEKSQWAGRGEFDKVFSSAAIHWMKKDPEAVIRGVHSVLRTGGTFVAELGGFGNLACIHAALIAALKRRNITDAEKYLPFFPTPAHYKSLLAPYFSVTSIQLVPRPTLLPTDMAGWVTSFGSHFLEALPEDQRGAVLEEVDEQCRPVLRDEEGGWWADYVRLRVVAVKK